jgi:predicted small metal-binding protein
MIVCGSAMNPHRVLGRARSEVHTMKQFSCGDVVPGCQATFEAEQEGEILAKVAAHAQKAHGMDDVPPEVVAQVKAKIREK